MDQIFTFPEFNNQFPDDDSCLEEIKKHRYPKGMHCPRCKKITRHYRIKGRTAYSCRFCRNQIFPLSGTIFEKSTTPLQLWFYALFLMTHTRANMTAKQLQRELGVTYKTAWRMYKQIRTLMAQNKGDLLYGTPETVADKIHKWVFFNKIQFTVVQKEESSE